MQAALESWFVADLGVWGWLFGLEFVVDALCVMEDGDSGGLVVNAQFTQVHVAQRHERLQVDLH